MFSSEEYPDVVGASEAGPAGGAGGGGGEGGGEAGGAEEVAAGGGQGTAATCQVLEALQADGALRGGTGHPYILLILLSTHPCQGLVHFRLLLSNVPLTLI